MLPNGPTWIYQVVIKIVYAPIFIPLNSKNLARIWFVGQRVTGDSTLLDSGFPPQLSTRRLSTAATREVAALCLPD